MKTLATAISFALLSTLTFTAPSANADEVATSICNYVSVDDKKRLRAFLKSNKLKVRNIFDSVKCNGQNLLAFAANRSSIKTGTMMINKLPKNKVESLLPTINASKLTDIAAKRINS